MTPQTAIASAMSADGVHSQTSVMLTGSDVVKQAATSVWEKLMYLAGGSVIGAIVALLVVWYLIVRWWTKR